MSIIYAIIIGGICGWLAGQFMNAPGGLIRNIILGIVGGAVGDAVFKLLGFVSIGIIGDIISGLVGSCIVIAIVAAITGKK